MKSVTDIFIRHPVLAIVVNLVLVLLGVRCAMSLPVQQYPKLESTSITINTVYFGASAETIRGFLTTPIERAVSSIAGIDYIESSSLAGLSTVTIRLNLNHDSTKALAEVNARLQQVRSELPSEAEPPTIELVRADRPYASFYLSFTSDEFDLSQLTDYLARNVRPRLSILKGVQKVGIEAGRTPAMRIWISPTELTKFNLTPGDVYSALQRNNFLAAIGQVKSDSVQVDLLTNTDLRSVAEFENLIVKQVSAGQGGPGTIIRLSDVARVEFASEEPTMTAMYRGREAIYISVWPLPGTNEIDVSTRLRAAMEDLRPDLPGHIDMGLAYDGTKFMRKSLAEISKTLAETMMIVGFVVFLFMGSARTALVPVVAMPVSLIGATLLMTLLGFSLNLLTLLAIVLAVGLVVDDAIVVVENIQRHIQEGSGRVHSALIGARELIGPVITMTITLATVYAPIGFQGGLTGMLFREFAFTLAAAVVVSGIVAVTLSPVMSAYVIPPGGREGWMTRTVNAIFDLVRRVYARVLVVALRLRVAIVLATLLAALTAIPLYTFSARELAPVEDEGAIAVMLTASPDSTLKASTRWASKLAESFSTIPETDYMWSLVSASGGFGGVITTNWDERDRDTQQILPEVFMNASQNQGLEATPVLVPPLPGAGNFDVELLMKSDLPVQRQRELADEIVRRAREANMFMFVDTDLKVDLPQARVVVDRERLADLGLDQAAVGRELGVLLGGGYVNRFNHFNRSYRVIPQLEARDRQSSQSLMDLHVRGPGGQLIPVSAFASIEPETAPRALARFQQQSAVRIFAVVFPGITKTAGLATLEGIAEEVAGGAVSLDYAGESRQIRQEGTKLATTLGFALVLIYLVLAAQFRSFRDPLIVLFGSVPLAMTAVLTLTCLGFTTINIYSQVGLITLVGLVAKNGILIVEFANSLRQQGHDKWDAIVQASGTRLRPVLMTSVATVFGHMPLVFVVGAGAAARNSIGIVLVIGMAVGTVFTLFVVPALYLLVASEHQATAATDAPDGSSFGTDLRGSGLQEAMPDDLAVPATLKA